MKNEKLEILTEKASKKYSNLARWKAFYVKEAATLRICNIPQIGAIKSGIYGGRNRNCSAWPRKWVNIYVKKTEKKK